MSRNLIDNQTVHGSQNKIVPRIEVCRLFQLLHEVNLVVKKRAVNMNKKIVDKIKDSCKIKMKTDGVRIQQIYFNMLEDAINYSTQNSEIRVSSDIRKVEGDSS